MTGADRRSDQELIAAANRGDGSAFEALYLRYREWVVGLACRLTRHREDALDVLQETFAYFFGKFPGFRLTAKLTTFLYPAIRNLSLARVRERRRTTPAADLGADLVVPVEESAPAAASDLEALLAGLNEGERAVLVLRFVDGLALKEIAEALDIPLGTVKSRLHNALAALRNDPRARKYFEA